MEEGRGIDFGPYRLAGPVGPLWRHTQEVNVPPKAVAVLWELVSRAGEIVTKEELLAKVWTGTVVGDEALTTCLRRLRLALQETAEAPRYIQTVHRIGYRFIAAGQSPKSKVQGQEDEQQRAKSRERGAKRSPSSPIPHSQLPTPVLVGRDAELAQLHNLFAKALHGERQIVFVTGEAGIGKTALIETFVQGLVSRVQSQEDERKRAGSREQGGKMSSASSAPSSVPPAPCFAWGQCIEHYGAGEAYLPLLEALGRLCRAEGGERVLARLRQFAPSWVVQLPALLSDDEYAALQQRVVGTTRERMLREIVEALEVLSAERPVVLVLEDLHWSDASTIAVLSMVARRRDAARLLVVGTCRPADLIVSNHPLKAVKQELVARRQGVEVVIERLSADHVQQYLQQHVAATVVNPTVTEFVYRRTEGHPLFMVQMADYLAQQGEALLDTTGVQGLETTLPQQLRAMIDAQVGRLTPVEQEVLEAGSVAGAEFTLGSVAAALEKPIAEVETLCEYLARRGQFIIEREVSRWPDGTVSGRYGFRHTLYQEVLYQRVSASRRVRFHQQIGVREEAAYGERAAERAAELAMHFERGQQPQQAITYLHLAAGVMLQRQAHQEAIASLHRALELLQSFPDSLARVAQELSLQVLLGVALMTSKGFAAPEAESAYARARELCQRLGDTPQIVPALVRLLSFYTFRGELPLGAQIADQVLQLVQHRHDPEALLEAHLYKGIIEYFLGNWEAARRHCEAVLPLYDAESHHAHAFHYGYDPGIIAHSILSSMLWHLGYPAQALQQSRQALTLAAQREHPPSLAIALWLAVVLRAYLHEWAEVQRLAAEMQALVSSQGLVQWIGFGMYAQGWARAAMHHEESGLALMAQGLTAYRGIGADLGTYSMQAWLAEQYGQAGHFADAQRLLAETFALISRTQEVAWSGEFYRLKGELFLNAERGMQNDERKTRKKSSTASSIHHSSFIVHRSEEAEEYFLKAVEIARTHQAKSFELRAVMSLVRLRQRQTQHATRNTQHATRTALTEAHTMLSEVYGWFTEGFETTDLQEAKALLDSLESSV